MTSKLHHVVVGENYVQPILITIPSGRDAGAVPSEQRVLRRVIKDLPDFVCQFAANKKADEKWTFLKCTDFEMAHRFVQNETSHSVVYPLGSEDGARCESKRASSHTLHVVAGPKGYLKMLR